MYLSVITILIDFSYLCKVLKSLVKLLILLCIFFMFHRLFKDGCIICNYFNNFHNFSRLFICMKSSRSRANATKTRKKCPIFLYNFTNAFFLFFYFVCFFCWIFVTEPVTVYIVTIYHFPCQHFFYPISKKYHLAHTSIYFYLDL